MQPRVVGAVIERIAARWRLVDHVEITLEANPTSVEAERFAGFRSAGVNRVSIGVQALNDPDLRRLGRLHTAHEALQALETARAEFARVSFDLIYARQDQSLSDWESELSQALSLAADHLSLYQLTIEPQTAFGDRYDAGKLLGLPHDDLAADMYSLTQDLTAAQGLPAYEVSNHARPGAESRHNLIYWRGQDYLGIGPGAHGRLTLDGTRYATEAPRAPGPWLRGDRELPRVALSPEENGQEFLLMGLRLREGVDMDRFRQISGTALSKTTLADLKALELIQLDGNRLKASGSGLLVLNSVLQCLMEQ